MKVDWPFDDPPNTASLTTLFVLDGSPILHVYHDYDGGWQFYGAPDDLATANVARIVSLESIIARDTSLAEISDLPYGWRAVRTSGESSWTREKNNPFPTYVENGYYLEDAVWLSQYRDDVDLPPAALRNNLSVCTYVKLLFRFAFEDAEREGNQTERMWVLMTEGDGEGNYIGTLENDPNHSGMLTCGDIVYFHPFHVMEILDENGA